MSKAQTPDVNQETDELGPEEASPTAGAAAPQAQPAQPNQPSSNNSKQQQQPPPKGDHQDERDHTSGHGADPSANNNNPTGGSRKTMNHIMVNDSNADASSAAMGAPPRASVGQTIGTNGGGGAHQHYSQSQTGHFANNNNSAGHHLRSTESDEEDFSGGGNERVSGPSGQYGGGWGQVRNSSRAVSPSLIDNMSENSSQAPMPGQMVRSKSRPEILGPTSSRYNNTSFWKARRVLFYKNGDPFFPGVEYRFKPTRDISTLEALLDKISPKIDLPRGARYVFSMDGDRKYSLDELEDGASYVLSSFKIFKVSGCTFSF